MNLYLYYLSFDEFFARGFPGVPCYADLGLFDVPETLKLAIENAPPSVKVLSLDYQCCTSDLKEFGRDRGMVIVPKFRSPETTQMFQMLRAQADRLQAFKDYVHARLDEAGVPVDPESPHKAAGCRIGGRLDWVFQRADRLEAVMREELVKVYDRMGRLGCSMEAASTTEGYMDEVLKRVKEGR